MSEVDYKNGWNDGYQECLELGEEERLVKVRKQGALDELERQKKELIENIIPMEKVRIKECEEHQIKSLSQFHKENLFYENVILKGIELRIKELEGGVEK